MKKSRHFYLVFLTLFLWILQSQLTRSQTYITLKINQTKISLCDKITTSVDDSKELKELKVFPVPAKNYLTVKNSGSAIKGNVTICIYNQIGQKVISVNKTVDGFIDERIDVSSLIRGMYILKYSDKEQSITKKIIVE